MSSGDVLRADIALRSRGTSHRVGVRVRVRVRVRVKGEGVLPTTSHCIYYIVGLAKTPYPVIINHKSGRMLIRISSSLSLGFVTMLSKAALLVFS